MTFSYLARVSALVLFTGLGVFGCGSDSKPPAAATGGSIGAGGGAGGHVAGGGAPGAGGANGGAGGEGGDVGGVGGQAVDAGAGGSSAPDTNAPVDTVIPPPDLAPPPDVGPSVPADVDGRLVINEIMASNGLTLKNEVGMAGDWIELYNPTNQDISLTNYSLTDDLTMPRKTLIGTGVVVPAGKYLILWLDSLVGHGNTHLQMKLESMGGSIGLARPDGSFISKLTYGGQETDFSASREPDGSDAWVIEWHPSPGASNPAGAGKPLAVATAATPPEAVPASGDLTEKMLGLDVMTDLKIDVDADGVAKLMAAPTVAVPGTLTYQGRAYGPVGVRLKGNNSFEPIDKKPSIKIAVDKYTADARFFGLKDITLNNMHSDPTMMHERMAYWVARTAGVPASRAAYSRVTLNGRGPSLYIMVEAVKHKMLTRWFPNADGPLYEGNQADFNTAETANTPMPEDAIVHFGLESNVDDRKSLYGVANALKMASAPAAIAAATPFLNVDEFWSFWAVCSMVGQFDSWPYSMPGDDYFVYVNPADGKVNMLPWGMDETFEAADVNVITRAYSLLTKKCIGSPNCIQGYANKTWALLEKLEAMNWGAERARIAALIAPDLAADKARIYTAMQTKDAQDNMQFFVAERRQWLTKYLPAKTQ
jgi:hypothetical protein